MFFRARTPAAILVLLLAHPASAADPAGDAASADEAAALRADGPSPSLLAALATPANFRYRSVTVYWDNDGTVPNIIEDTDRYYTSGQGFEVGFDFVPPEGLASRLAPGWTDPRFGVGLSLKQHIYTAADISDPTPADNDHPYAGWLSFNLALQRSDRTRHDHLGISVGVVGPSSLAEDIQKWVHDEWPDEIDPAGWDGQLGDEFAVNLTYQRTWRSEKAEAGGLSMDMLPAVRFDAGNVFLRARGQATLRLGVNLPDDFGPASFLGFQDHTGRGWSDPGTPLSVYAWATVAADAVGHSIFLDGTVFEDSRSTDREVLVARATVGLALRYKCVSLGWSQTFETDTFESQIDGQTWGSIALTVACRF
jgi:hypothetical protein